MQIVLYILAFLSGEGIRFLTLGRAEYFEKGHNMGTFIRAGTFGTLNVFLFLEFFSWQVVYPKAIRE